MYTEARAASAWRASGALGAPQVHSIHSIWLKGHPTELPLRGQGRPGPDHSLEEFQYSAGFFDGAGHVVEDVSGWRLELTLPSEQQDPQPSLSDGKKGVWRCSSARLRLHTLHTFHRDLDSLDSSDPRTCFCASTTFTVAGGPVGQGLLSAYRTPLAA